MIAHWARRMLSRVKAPTVCLALLTVGLSGAVSLDHASGQPSSPQTTADVYYKTEGVPVGPPAPPSGATVYARYGSLDNRILVWFVTQQHTYFGGFVLALPIFCVIIELMGLLARDGARAARYDRMARDFLKVSLLANGWVAFMMSPAGVDEQGRYLGNVWHLMHSALWNPLNVHRFLADLMSGGAVVLAYASYRFLTSKSDEERAYYDWVGYVFLFVTVCALLPMPFAGYWLMRSVFAFRQTMGVTMMGGLLTWLFVVQALLIGVLFLGVNYYLWQSMGRIHGGERYQRYFKYLVWAMMACVVIWLTPHTLMMSSGEVKAMGGAQHPVVGNYGVMSAKNGAINVMICLTGLSYILYRRANRTLTVSWLTAGNSALAAGFVAGVLNIVWLAVYGFYLPASIRVGLSSPQALTTFTVLFL